MCLQGEPGASNRLLPVADRAAVKIPANDCFFDEGLQDYIEGSDLRDCPYGEGTDGQNGWRAGWHHGAGVDEQGRRDA